jgi:hypothetical protein
MEGMGSTNMSIVKIPRKRQHRTTKKSHHLGKTITNQSIQPNDAGLS